MCGRNFTEFCVNSQALLERKFPDGLRSQYSYALSGYAASGAPGDLFRIFLVFYNVICFLSSGAHFFEHVSVYIGATGNFAYGSTTKAGPESALEAERLITQGVLRAMRAGLQVPGSPGAIIIGDLKGFREPEDPNGTTSFCLKISRLIPVGTVIMMTQLANSDFLCLQ